ncbi:hypothetical protein AB0I49_02750 [Streptomyces sp. NPDC050617]|uniref:hypothetical protein n=1 Tax=Streptomyces sp. NPDC050617 TaxID=3154628 RepID=UPI0034218A1E
MSPGDGRAGPDGGPDRSGKTAEQWPGAPHRAPIGELTGGSASAAPGAQDGTANERPGETPKSPGSRLGEDESDGPDDDYDDFDGYGDENAYGYQHADAVFGPYVDADRQQSFIFAPGANVNAGSVHGGQHVKNQEWAAGPGGRRAEAYEGPVSEAEILEARLGFAKPDWFPAALEKLDTRVLFLTGEPGTGRRTAALNLLYHHSGESMALRAVDNDTDLSSWRPTHTEARGYLVDGLLLKQPLKPAVVGNLRRLLTEAHARMVVVLPYDPGLVRSLERDLHVSPVRYRPPAPRAVFEERFQAAVPDPAERERLLGGLEKGLLDELLVPELVPAEVAELVAAVVASGEGGAERSDIRNRLSFLAEGEAPDLIRSLCDDADGLAFLLATCVFEGLDHRIVREEAERLLKLAEGRLNSVLPRTDDRGEGGDDGEGRAGRNGPEPSRPNPQFVFRRSLEHLLWTVRAQCAPKEVRSGPAFAYSVEPVYFTRHRQAEAVLKYVWREYGQLSEVLASWMDQVRNENDLTQPVGRVMGMAAGWGGGRQALRHIAALAKSDRRSSRDIAAYALGVAAEDPVLATEVKHRLSAWSHARGTQLRCTVAHACGTDFGASRPDLALRLLRSLSYGLDDTHEYTLRTEVGRALVRLFESGNQAVVFRNLTEWAGHEGPDAELALGAFPQLLRSPLWFQGELLEDGEFAEQIIALIRRTLSGNDNSEATRRALVGWSRMAVWSDQLQEAVELLFTDLARNMQHGVLGLFVEIDRHEDTEMAGREIARAALSAWRRGEPTARTADVGPAADGSAYGDFAHGGSDYDGTDVRADRRTY